MTRTHFRFLRVFGFVALAFLSFSAQASFKMAPIYVAKLVAESDAIVFAVPTPDPYVVKIVSVIACKPGIKLDALERMTKSPPRDPYELEVWDYKGFKNPAIIFLKRAASGPNKWRELSGFYDWIGINKTGRVVSDLVDDYERWSDKPIPRLRIGYITFPLTLNPRYRGYATLKDLTRELQRIAKVQAAPALKKR